MTGLLEWARTTPARTPVIAGPTLRGLILQVKADRSYAWLSRQCNGVPTDKRLHQLVSEAPRNFPDPDTIRGLATGCRVSVADVVLAAARGLGLDVAEQQS